MGTSPPVRGLSPNRMEMVTPAPGKPTGEVGGSADSTCCWTSIVQRRVSTRTFSPRLLRRASMGRSIESPGLSVAWAVMATREPPYPGGVLGLGATDPPGGKRREGGGPSPFLPSLHHRSSFLGESYFTISLSGHQS